MVKNLNVFQKQYHRKGSQYRIKDGACASGDTTHWEFAPATIKDQKACGGDVGQDPK